MIVQPAKLGTLYLLVSAPILMLLASPAAAQHSMDNMPGMGAQSHTHTPMPNEPGTKEGPAEPATPSSTMNHGSEEQSAPKESPPTSMPVEPPADHETMDGGSMDHSMMTMDGQGGHQPMTGAFGSYPMQRDSSGTAWQPDTSGHSGVTVPSGDWMLMGHALLNLVYDHQSDNRGDDKMFVSGMAMGMARRLLGNGTLQLRAMLSPDPAMGRRGYPLLLASGETANGVDRLVDRQHPHDLFMELSASVSQNIGARSSLFLYGGLPGEPAFGPPAFMHREAILDSPEAPISHHWLDSTHISFGVVTAGLVFDRAKLEVSRFNGREPDENRWNIETGPLDSTSVRISWNPSRTLALQASWGHFEEPEELEPGVDQKRWSASALYTEEISPGWRLAATFAWGRKTIGDHKDDAVASEVSVRHGAWTIFGRGEIAENRELVEVDHGRAFQVGKVSLGAIHDFSVAEHMSLGVGGLFALNFVPGVLATLYGSDTPIGTMGFVRVKID